LSLETLKTPENSSFTKRWRQNKRPSDTASSNLEPIFLPLVGSGRGNEDISASQLELIKTIGKDRQIIIATDNDETGSRYAKQIKELAPVGTR
jgi:hypothetical protein